MALRRHLAWMALSQSAFFLIQFTASVIIAHFISPYEMGVYAVALAASGIVSVIQNMGLTGFVVREAEVSRPLLSSVFTINAAISWLVAGLIIGASALAGGFLHNDGVRRVMLAVACLPLIGMFEFLPAARLEREANFKTIALIGGARTLVAQGLSVWLAMSGFSYMSIAYGQIAGALFSAAAYGIAGRRFWDVSLQLSEWRRIGHFGTQMLAVSGAYAIGGRLSDILLGRLISLAALGLYGRAASLNSMIQDNIYMVIVRVLFVDIAEQVRQRKSLRASYLTTMEILTAVLWPAFGGLGLVAGPFIRVVYGQKWVAAAPALLMLSLAAMVHVMVSLSWQLFVVRQEVTRQTRLEFMRTIVGTALFALGCQFGLAAAAAARIGEAVFTVIIYRPHIGRMTATRTADLVPIYGRSLLLTIATLAPAGLVMAAHGWSPATSLAQLCPAMACGVLLWGVGVLSLGHPLAIEFHRLRAGFKNRAVKAPPPSHPL